MIQAPLCHPALGEGTSARDATRRFTLLRRGKAPTTKNTTGRVSRAPFARRLWTPPLPNGSKRSIARPATEESLVLKRLATLLEAPVRPVRLALHQVLLEHRTPLRHQRNRLPQDFRTRPPKHRQRAEVVAVDRRMARALPGVQEAKDLLPISWLAGSVAEINVLAATRQSTWLRPRRAPTTSSSIDPASLASHAPRPSTVTSPSGRESCTASHATPESLAPRALAILERPVEPWRRMQAGESLDVDVWTEKACSDFAFVQEHNTPKMWRRSG
mmetsp:Transcript_16786/g.33618  ORF Transcript_16786/g.33618 Transcript_16786/m.33618 type:complete len:273 (+) Transcript_16786:268-1086(+)